MNINSLFEGIDYSCEPDHQDFVTFNKADAELQYKMYNIENEKEKKDMLKVENHTKDKNINTEIKQLVINEEEGIVTSIGESRRVYIREEDRKIVQMAKTAKGDEFDKYVGAALALVYQLFGSKTQFKKYVDNEAKYVKQIKEKKEKAKQKKQGN